MTTETNQPELHLCPNCKNPVDDYDYIFDRCSICGQGNPMKPNECYLPKSLNQSKT